MKIVDANVLLYAVNVNAEQHEAARTWLDGALSGRETIGFGWSVLLAFLRVGTHPAVFPRPLSAVEAMHVLRDWLSQPTTTIVEPTERHLDILGGLLERAGTAGNLVSDAHLATLAIEHAAELVSFDSDFDRFDGLRWSRPAS